jgi:hypothetical protein
MTFQLLETGGTHAGAALFPGMIDGVHGTALTAQDPGGGSRTRFCPLSGSRTRFCPLSGRPICGNEPPRHQITEVDGEEAGVLAEHDRLDRPRTGEHLGRPVAPA